MIQKEAQNEISSSLNETLQELGEIRSFKTGEVVLDEHSHVRAIPVVQTGILKVIRTEEDGREILLYFIKPGESCVMSFLGGLHQEKSVVRAEVEEDADILFIPLEKLPFLMKDNPQWLDYIFKLYHKRFEELLEVINSIAFKKVDERLQNLLKRKSELMHSNLIHTTHEQLANELGTVRVVVSRLLKQLEESGEVKLGRNKIELLHK